MAARSFDHVFAGSASAFCDVEGFCLRRQIADFGGDIRLLFVTFEYLILTGREIRSKLLSRLVLRLGHLTDDLLHVR